MKNSIIKTILGMVAIISLFLACSEAESRLGQALWSGSCLLVAGLSAKGVEKYMTDEEREEEV